VSLGRAIPAPALGACLLAQALAAFLSAGCELTPADLQSWPWTENGRGKLAAVVADVDRDQELRLSAARLLVEIGGVEELADALARTPSDDRTRLVSRMTPILVRMLAGPPEQQAHAKDAIHFVGGYAPEVDRRLLGQQLLRWALADFPKRLKLGGHALSKVLPALGTQAAPQLLHALRSGAVADEITWALVALGSPEVDQSTAQILDELVRMKLPAIPPTLVSAVLKLKNSNLTPLLLQVASDPQVSREIRAAFLDHVVDCGGSDAAPGLARLLGDLDFRWMAAQNLIALEGLDGLKRILRSLPEDGPYPDEEEELFQAADFFCEQEVPRTRAAREEVEQALIEGMQQGGWPGKLLAVHCLGFFGSKAALTELSQLTGDARRVPGWKPVGVSLGQVAREVAVRLQAQ
jgi:hypothetical protein